MEKWGTFATVAGTAAASLAGLLFVAVSIRTDVINAGGAWEDSAVVTDKGLITSRNPGDLDAFSSKIIEEMAEGRHSQRSAA